MEKATYVIDVLENFNRRSIEYENKVWLRNNVETLNITVSKQDCDVSVYDIKALLGENDVIVIQNGKELKDKREFSRKKEALLVIGLPCGGNCVCRYCP